MTSVYSEEQLLIHLKDLGKELGRAPSMRDMNDAKDRPTAATYQYRFDSWVDALVKAGYKEKKSYTKKYLISKIQELGKRLDRVPMRKDINDSKDCPNIDTMIRHFGSYDEAIKAAGMEPLPPFIKTSDDFLIERLKDACKEVGHPPSQDEFNSMEGYPRASVYVERFGWNNAFKKAGIEKTLKRIPDEKMLEDIQKATAELGHSPSFKEMNSLKEKYSNPKTIATRFGSWNNALRKAGVGKHLKGYSDEKLLYYMSRVKKKFGHLPTFKEMLNINGPSPITYMKHFGSWKNAKKVFKEYERGLEDSPAKMLQLCKSLDINYITLRDMLMNLVDTESINEFENNLGNDSIRYMIFLETNFRPLSKRARMESEKEAKLLYDNKEKMYVLKLE